MFLFFQKIWYFFFKIFNSKLVSPFFFKKQYLNSYTYFNRRSFFKKAFIAMFFNSSSYKNNALNKFRKSKFPTFHKFHVDLYAVDIKKFRLVFLNRFFKLFSLFFKKNDFFKSKNTFFSFYILLFILRKKIYKFVLDQNINKKKFIQISFLSLILFFKRFGGLKKKTYNLNNVSHWYNYLFKSEFFHLPKKKVFNIKPDSFFKNLKNIRRYNEKFVNIAKSLKINFHTFLKISVFIFDKNSFTKVLLNKDFFNKNVKYFPIRFNESSTNKFVELSKLKDYSFFFLRKNRIFNKGRYSRNRQTYRTGVYWCLWFNILSVYGLYFIFYRFTFNFGYLFFPLIFFFGSFLFSRLVKYNFFTINGIINEINKFYNWSALLYSNLVTNLFYFFKKKIHLINNINYIHTNLNFFEKPSLLFVSFVKDMLYNFEKTESESIEFIWEYNEVLSNNNQFDNWLSEFKLNIDNIRKNVEK